MAHIIDDERRKGNADKRRHIVNRPLETKDLACIVLFILKNSCLYHQRIVAFSKNFTRHQQVLFCHQEGVAAADNLNEMQCMWYQTECAGAYARKQEWGNALRQCHQIDKVPAAFVISMPKRP